jgi:DNA-3-methyladenine glycosylase
MTRCCQQEWFSGSVESVAAKLLGCQLVRVTPLGLMSGIIVEVEAYLSRNDPASHSAAGPTRKNGSMFGPAGILYVYPIHSRHCLNVVTEPEGVGSAVLIRAIEPIQGLNQMAQNRRLDWTEFNPQKIAQQRALTSGPGRLCEALDVDRRLNGVNLMTSDQLWIEPAPEAVAERQWKKIRTGRIGIRLGNELKLRWIVSGNQFVSGPASDHPEGRCWRFCP